MTKLLDRFGELITEVVGTMYCAIAFAILALFSLPDAIKGGREHIITWISTTFLQLVLLSIIMVGQQIQAAKNEQRDQETHDAVLDEHEQTRNLIRELHAQNVAARKAAVRKTK